MSTFLAAHGGQILLATAALGLALIATLIWIVAHLEKRLQHVAHELADLRAHLDLPGLTPEVTKRYDAIQAAGTVA